MKARPVEIHIRELVIEGFSAREAARIHSGLEAELVRRFTSPAALPSSSQVHDSLSAQSRGPAQIPSALGNALESAMRSGPNGGPAK
jgi:hypothetical protein